MDFEKMYRNAAAGIIAETPIICCIKCLRKDQLTLEDTILYLKNGWPQCCNATMNLGTTEKSDPVST